MMAHDFGIFFDSALASALGDVAGSDETGRWLGQSPGLQLQGEGRRPGEERPIVEIDAGKSGRRRTHQNQKNCNFEHHGIII